MELIKKEQEGAIPKTIRRQSKPARIGGVLTNAHIVRSHTRQLSHLKEGMNFVPIEGQKEILDHFKWAIDQLVDNSKVYNKIHCWL